MTAHLIINADDLGQSHGINRGIEESVTHGLVTSASLMVRWPAAEDAATLPERHPGLSVGLHIDLGEWAFEHGWHPIYEVVPLDDGVQIRAEMDRQVDRFVELVGQSPTHIDGHQHVHRSEQVGAAAAHLAGELGIPLRGASSDIRFLGGFYGQDERGGSYPEAISPDRLTELIESLTTHTYEVSCHPGYSIDFETMYREERAREVETLCDPGPRAAIDRAGIHLISFSQLGRCPHCRRDELGLTS